MDEKGQWITCRKVASLSSWIPVEILADTITKTYSMRLQVGNVWETIANDIPIKNVDEFNSVFFFPSGIKGGVAYIKDFSFRVNNPAFKEITQERK